MHIRTYVPLGFVDKANMAKLDCKTVVFGRFRKARSAVSAILACEARSVSPHSPSPFSLRSRPPCVLISTVARVRKKYDCFAVYGKTHAQLFNHTWKYSALISTKFQIIFTLNLSVFEKTKIPFNTLMYKYTQPRSQGLFPGLGTRL